MEQRPGLGIEPLAHQLGERGAVARRRGDGGETQPFGGGRGGVAHREHRPAALLARFGERAGAVGAGEQDGLAGGERGGEAGRRMQDLQRNSGAMTGTWPRSLSAVASAVASRSGRVISTRMVLRSRDVRRRNDRER